MLKKEIKKKNLIEILGLESLPVEAQMEVVDSAVGVIEMRCLNEVLEALDEQGKKQFLKIVEKEDFDKLGDFFKEKNIDFATVLEGEVMRFKEEVAHQFSR